MMRADYLYERTYGEAGSVNPSGARYQEWQAMLGEELLYDIAHAEPAVRAYLNGVQPEESEEKEEAVRGNVRLETGVSEERGKRIRKEIRAEIQAEIRAGAHGQFELFYAGFFAAGEAAFLEKTEKLAICGDGVLRQFRAILCSRLRGIGVRTLIAEMNLLRAQNRLCGKDAVEQYRYFESQYLEDEGYRARILEKYPVLERCLQEETERTAEFYGEALGRARADKEQIEAGLLGGDAFETVSAFGNDSSDSHSGGKTVLRLCLNNGKEIIYKPHSMENEKTFARLAAAFAAECGTDLYFPAIIDCGEYGWSECIGTKTCETEEELRRYYRRIGICLFLSYLLGIHDLHYENIIAHGEYPVLIDLENLIGTGGTDHFSDVGEFLKAKLKESVLYSGILPYRYWNQNGRGVDTSAVNGYGGQKMPFKISVIRRMGTAEICVGYEFGQTKQSGNRACLNGKFQRPGDYEEEILSGFTAAYQYAEKHRQEVAELMKPLEMIRGRYLSTDTQKYSMLLSASYHPSLMTDGARRELFLYSVWKGKDMSRMQDREIAKAELRDLLNQDIPHFTFLASQSSILDSGKNEIEGCFEEKPIDGIYRRLKGLEPEDLKLQRRLIHLALNGTEEVAKRAENAGNAEKTEITEMTGISEIAEKLLDEAVFFRGEQNIQVGWYSIKTFYAREKSCQIDVMGRYLYDGLAGILLFLERLCTAVELQDTKRGQYERLRDMVRRQLFDYTDRVRSGGMKPDSRRSGLFNGEASIVYAYLLCYQTGGDEKYLQYAEKHGDIIRQLSLTDEGNDLLDGKAGTVIAFCLLYEAAGNELYKRYAEETAILLCKLSVHLQGGFAWEQEDGLPLTGMAHGNAGIAAAFAYLWKATSKDIYLKILEGILRYEDVNYGEEIEDWYDFRGNAGKENQRGKPAAWCYGAGGILLSRLLILEITDDDAVRKLCKKDCSRALRKLLKSWNRDEMCLCHGVCGNLLILRKYEQSFGADQISVSLREAADYVSERLSQRTADKILESEWCHPGFMNGYVGIGWYLLEEYCRLGLKNDGLGKWEHGREKMW